jgi:hypothetical protein
MAVPTLRIVLRLLMQGVPAYYLHGMHGLMGADRIAASQIGIDGIGGFRLISLGY